MESYKIGDVVKKLNINKETIRYYERIGLLSKPKRTSNGYRIYSEEDVNIIWFIQIAKEFGFTLKEIKILILTIFSDVIGGDAKRIVEIVNYKIDEIENRISELDKTRELLQRVKDSVISQKRECFTAEGIFEENA